MQRTLATLMRFARDPYAPLLLTGESGVGKTTLAREVHAWSARASGPFVSVDLGATDDALAGSELFGHVAGAYTDARSQRAGAFATANRGTLFLDEIGKASLAIQQRLLAALESREIRPVGSDRPVRVDVRVIAASNRPLAQLVAEGRFLPDLEARLEAFAVEVPPLRERRADIPAMVMDALQRLTSDGDPERLPCVDKELMQALRSARWPNNVRQLNASVHRLLIEADGAPVLGFEHCRGPLAYLAESRAQQSLNRDPASIRALVAQTGSVTRAAELLGMHRATVHRHLKLGSSRLG